MVMSEKQKPQPPSSEEHTAAAKAPIDLATIAALVRTALASQRSLMAWIRTSVSMFTFGFSITQFFYFMEQQHEGTQFSAGPRRLGVALIGVGILALVLAIVEHVQVLRKLKEMGLPAIPQYSLSIGSAVAILTIGGAALISIVFNWSL